MHRRCAGWDYKGRGIYMITLVVRERQPLLGSLVTDGSTARIELSPLGRSVSQQAENISTYYPRISVLCKQVMPDHLHLLLFVKEPLPVHLTSVVSGFKTGCTKAYKASLIEIASTTHPDITQMSGRGTTVGDNVKEDAAYPRMLCAADFYEAGITEQKQQGLWESGYHDRILFHKGQLNAMINYIHDNPHRLALKRTHPELFRIRQQQQFGTLTCTALGNIFLATHPQREVLQCSRSLTQEQIDDLREQCLSRAANGTIFVSAAISEGEKQISRALRKAGYKMIILLTEGFPAPDSPHYKYFKPQGVYFEACAAGRLLLLEPTPEMFDRPEIETAVYAKTGIHDLPHKAQRYRFLALNAMAAELCHLTE